MTGAPRRQSHEKKPARARNSSPEIVDASVAADLAPLLEQAGTAERFLKAIGSRHRLVILCELQTGEKSVTELQNALGLRQSALSQHLSKLRADSLVKTRRNAQTVYYSIADDKVLRLITLLYELFCADAAAPRARRRGRPDMAPK